MIESLSYARSEEGSLRDHIPQAGGALGIARSADGATMRVPRIGSPNVPNPIEKNAVSEQAAQQPTIET